MKRPTCLLLAMLTAAAVLSLRAADFDATSAEALIAKNQQVIWDQRLFVSADTNLTQAADYQ